MDITVSIDRASIGRSMTFIHYDVEGHPTLNRAMVSVSNFDQENFEVNLYKGPDPVVEEVFERELSKKLEGVIEKLIAEYSE